MPLGSLLERGCLQSSGAAPQRLALEGSTPKKRRLMRKTPDPDQAVRQFSVASEGEGRTLTVRVGSSTSMGDLTEALRQKGKDFEPGNQLVHARTKKVVESVGEIKSGETYSFVAHGAVGQAPVPWYDPVRKRALIWFNGEAVPSLTIVPGPNGIALACFAHCAPMEVGGGAGKRGLDANVSRPTSPRERCTGKCQENSAKRLQELARNMRAILPCILSDPSSKPLPPITPSVLPPSSLLCPTVVHVVTLAPPEWPCSF